MEFTCLGSESELHLKMFLIAETCKLLSFTGQGFYSLHLYLQQVEAESLKYKKHA